MSPRSASRSSIERADGTGYVELPYSLTQDSTLYLTLGETNNEIWKRKLAWVVKHGGMALVNVHPDYIAFQGKPSRSEFPVKIYESFLEHVSREYGDTAWHVLPREVAQFTRESVLAGGVRKAAR